MGGTIEQCNVTCSVAAAASKLLGRNGKFPTSLDTHDFSPEQLQGMSPKENVRQCPKAKVEFIMGATTKQELIV